jgi:glycosyltransferase involved in cell wall biosynthesis
MPPVATVKRLKNEFYSFVKYLAVRRARRIFVLSSRNGWEVKKLFRRKAVVLKGAFPLSIFDYVQKIDVKKQIGIEGKRMVLSICRLAVNKRVDLCIRAFAHLSRRVENVVLVIGGSGPEEEYLRSVVKELNLEPKVRFVGYVPDGELWDYVIASDLFVSLDLADFDIAPFEALALGRKVIWASEMEMDEALLAVRLLFPAEPTVVDVSLRMEGALNTVVTDDQIKKYRSILSKYSWEDYARKMLIQ